VNYQQAIEYIHGTLKFGSKLGLENISRLLELMGSPHKKLKYVHVAGTNGKGSTVSFISSILISQGYRTGIYISPYLQRFTERIKIDNEEIGEDDLARITAFVKSKIEIMISQGYNHPTEFEIVTAIAFQYYFEKDCDIVVLEVGLGGRYDSTNVIENPLAAVITTINYDHMNILGDTLAKIAYEKAGIIKPGCNVVLYPQDIEAEQVIERECDKKKAIIHKLKQEDIRILKSDIEAQIFDYDNISGLEISLLGQHQIYNACLAVKTALVISQTSSFTITEQAIRKGLKNAKWPGRFEILNKNPYVIIDGAHNEQGAVKLYQALNSYFPGKKIIFIFGVLGDKEVIKMIEAVAPIARCFIAVAPLSERALPASKLSAILRNYCNNTFVSDTIKEAVEKSLFLADSDDVICAFGSLYYIGVIRDYFGMVK